MSREPIPADRGTGPAEEQKPPSGSGVGGKVGSGVAVTMTNTVGGGSVAGTGVFVGGSVGFGVRVGRSVGNGVGVGDGVAVAVGVGVRTGVLVGGTAVGVGTTGVLVGGTAVGVGATGVLVGGTAVGSGVGVGYPMKMISKSVLRAPLWNSSRETDLNPFRKNSTG